MKKTLLAITIITSLSACGGGDEDASTAPPSNTPPSMQMPAGIEHQLILGQEFKSLPLAQYFNDADGDPLTYKILSNGLDITINGASLNFGPMITAGSHVIQVVAVDDKGAESQPLNIKLTVTAPTPSPNTPPSMLVPAGIEHQLVLGQEYNALSLAQYFNDSDDDPLTYKLLSNGLDITINGASLIFGPKITAGSHVVRVIAVDDKGAESQPLNIKLGVIDPIIPSFTINGADKAYTANTLVALKVDFSSPSAHPISYTWVQESGVQVAIKDTNSATLEFVVPDNVKAQELNFKLKLETDYSSITESVKVAIYTPLSISPVDTPLTALGNKVPLIITGGNGNSVNFTSSSDLIATIDDKGEITPLSAGELTIHVTQEATPIFPALSDKINLIVAEAEDTTVYLDIPIQVTNEVFFASFNIPPITDDKDTSYTTFAKAKFNDIERIAELKKVEGIWQGVLQQVQANTPVALTTYSLDFAGQETYQHSQTLLITETENNELAVQQVPVEAENIVTTPIDRCENYVDNKGNIYPIVKNQSNREDGSILYTWGYEYGGQFIRHHECQPAYIEYYPSGRIFREISYLHGINHNNGGISYTSYIDQTDEDEQPIKSIEYRTGQDGYNVIYEDQPSLYEYHLNGKIKYKVWDEGKDNLYTRAFGPDSIGYSDKGTHKSMIWHNAEQMREKEKLFNEDGTPQWCEYIDALTSAKMLYTSCQITNELGEIIKTEADLDRQYGIDSNDEPIIEPINECTHFIDVDGMVYPIQSQTSSSGYVTTGYYKNGQYIYHNQCKPAMTRFYTSGNPEHAWTFRQGINTHPNGYTSFAYYDSLDIDGKPRLKMESKIENQFYVLVDDKPSVIKYYTNGDIQYQAWMKTNALGDWVYGRDAGPDIINYGYGANGEYQQKDIYWYNEAGEKLKRKYFDDSGRVDFCHYYQFDALAHSDDACLNESSLDAQFQIK